MQQPALPERRFGCRNLIENDHDVIDMIVTEDAPEALDASSARRKCPVAGTQVRIRGRDVGGGDDQPALIQQRAHDRRVVNVALGFPLVAVERRMAGAVLRGQSGIAVSCPTSPAQRG